MTAPGGQGDVPVWCSEHMEPYCPRHSAEKDAIEQCQFMAAAYPTLGAESCTEHRHDEPTFALARAFAVACQSPEPTDEQVAWMLDDAGAIVDDFDPAPAEWVVTEPQVTHEAGLDFTLTVNGEPYVVQQSEWEPSHPVSLATWREWGHEDDEDDTPTPPEVDPS